MHSKNEVELSFDARSVNEGFARMAVAAFVAELNPTLDEISDIKTAVSEEVTNAIIHGMWRGQWNRSTPQSRNWSAPGWDLHSWKRLWMKFRFSLRPEKEPACA